MRIECLPGGLAGPDAIALRIIGCNPMGREVGRVPCSDQHEIVDSGRRQGRDGLRAFGRTPRPRTMKRPEHGGRSAPFGHAAQTIPWSRLG